MHSSSFSQSFAILLTRSSRDLRNVQLTLRHNKPNASQWYLQFKDDGLKEIYNQIKFEQLFNKVKILRINVIALFLLQQREKVHYDE